MKLHEIMTCDIVQISPDDSIALAAKRMRENSVGCLVVTVAGSVKGIITDRDLIGCIHENHMSNQCVVATHMSRPVIVLNPEEDCMIAAKLMREKRIKRIPVATRGKLQGIVSMSDLAAFAAAEGERVESALRCLCAFIDAQGERRRRPRAQLTTDTTAPNLASNPAFAGERAA